MSEPPRSKRSRETGPTTPADGGGGGAAAGAKWPRSSRAHSSPRAHPWPSLAEHYHALFMSLIRECSGPEFLYKVLRPERRAALLAQPQLLPFLWALVQRHHAAAAASQQEPPPAPVSSDAELPLLSSLLPPPPPPPSPPARAEGGSGASGDAAEPEDEELPLLGPAREAAVAFLAASLALDAACGAEPYASARFVKRFPDRAALKHSRSIMTMLHGAVAAEFQNCALPVYGDLALLQQQQQREQQKQHRSRPAPDDADGLTLRQCGLMWFANWYGVASTTAEMRALALRLVNLHWTEEQTRALYNGVAELLQRAIRERDVVACERRLAYADSHVGASFLLLRDLYHEVVVPQRWARQDLATLSWYTTYRKDALSRETFQAYMHARVHRQNWDERVCVFSYWWLMPLPTRLFMLKRFYKVRRYEEARRVSFLSERENDSDDDSEDEDFLGSDEEDLDDDEDYLDDEEEDEEEGEEEKEEEGEGEDEKDEGEGAGEGAGEEEEEKSEAAAQAPAAPSLPPAEERGSGESLSPRLQDGGLQQIVQGLTAIVTHAQTHNESGALQAAAREVSGAAQQLALEEARSVAEEAERLRQLVRRFMLLRDGEWPSAAPTGPAASAAAGPAVPRYVVARELPEALDVATASPQQVEAFMNLANAQAARIEAQRRLGAERAGGREATQAAAGATAAATAVVSRLAALDQMLPAEHLTYWFVDRDNLVASMLNNIPALVREELRCEDGAPCAPDVAPSLESAPWLSTLLRPLSVRFTNEEWAVDQGGVRKECFEQFFRELFQPAQPLWLHDAYNNTYWPRRVGRAQTPATHRQLQQLWRKLGTLFGLAVCYGRRVPFPLPGRLFFHHWRRFAERKKRCARAGHARCRLGAGCDPLRDEALHEEAPHEEAPRPAEERVAFEVLEPLFEEAFPSHSRLLHRMRHYSTEEWEAADCAFQIEQHVTVSALDVSDRARDWDMVPLQQRLSHTSVSETFALRAPAPAAFGAAQTGRDDERVNADNFPEYYEAVVRFHCACPANLRWFFQGMARVLDLSTFDLFSAEELQATFCARPTFTVDELRARTVFTHFETKAGSADARVQTWFWEILREWDATQLEDLMLFVTSSPCLPSRLNVWRGSPNDQLLPSAQSCFDSLVLPIYSSKEIMRRKLLSSLEYKLGFGVK